jgi:hypothetical protein
MNTSPTHPRCAWVYGALEYILFLVAVSVTIALLLSG